MAKGLFFLRSILFENLSQLGAALIVAAPLCAGEPVVSRSQFLMGTTCTIEADLAPSALSETFQEIARVEKLISTWSSDSAISRLNGSRTVENLDPEVFGVISEAARWCEVTNGAFNPLVGPLVDVWNLRDGGRVPGRGDLEAALIRTRPENLRLDTRTRGVDLDRGAQFEEGGFGKGYAIDRALETLKMSGANNSVVDFGGQIGIDATAPRAISIAHPEHRDQPVASINVRKGSVSTSSGSEQSFETPDGPRSHIIDPRTGEALPPLGSVTVIHESALAADILSTALYVMGASEGLRWADVHGVAVIFIVPGEMAWNVIPSTAANNPGFELQSIDADFHLKGQN